jgi:hypothetical protein
MRKPDLIHVIFNGGSSDESQGIVSLRQKDWLFYTWGAFSGHHANGEVGVVTVGITDSDFKLLLKDGDDPNSYHDLANWDHVVELLTCPAFRLSEQITEQQTGNRSAGDHPNVELLVVVKGDGSQRQVRKIEAIVGRSASDVSRIGGNTDVLFHEPTEEAAAKLAARIGVKIEKLKFVESVTINRPLE